MTTEDDGSWILSPTVFTCVDEWRKVLPKIKGEEDGIKFAVSVDLGDAESFLAFNKAERAFAHKTQLNEPLAQTSFVVQIKLTN